MATKSNDIIIKDFRQGIGPSPNVGFGNMQGIDVFSDPGVAKLNNALDKKSSTTVTGLMKWKVKNPLVPAQVYGVDEAGVVYISTDSGATWAVLAGNTAGGTGQGLGIWKDYLFVPRATAVDLYGPLASSPAWRNSWAGLTMDSDTLWHPLLVSKNDGNLYGGAGRYVFSVEEVSGQTFTWNNSATYTVTAQALDLPAGYRIKCLAELGNNLMCGTWMGSNVDDIRIADIYPWDRSSPSFGAPIVLDEFGVHAMLNIQNALYILAGIEGRLFLSNGAAAQVIAQLPNYVANIEGGKYIETYPGALVSYKGRPFFGMSSGGSATTIGGMGVYSVQQTSKGNIMVMEHPISTGNDGSASIVKIGSLLPITRDTILVGWKDGSAFGIDKTNTANRLTSYVAKIDSPLYMVGTTLNKRTFTEGEFQLAKPLASGEGIKIEQRINLTDAFAVIGTYDFATLGAVTSHQFIPGIADAEVVQIRVRPTGSTTTPELKSVTLR